ncbi:hypothetical protein JYU34_013792 [Plutella xylostella]|uniref:Uncharacterized protein n=2 Tax=Plutella xylostella TaxID=51655 RepID=A0ABQ7QAT5_PLUXY|nr:nuclear nucleic acid-binding protein C1D [Plutella xylostella]KAG7302296.1 hypothetical protein JYU34_013792 [Plutella xylostella]CAG9123097.1 unnamed protein product [Plutella xylostella]
MNWNIKYGELQSDTDFVGKCENLKENLVELQNTLDQLLKLKQHYDKLDTNAQIELDLFLVYTLNSLQWVHLRIQGIDPTQTRIKGELQRIKKVMMRWQEVKDREKRPKVDTDAAKRFVKSGLYDHKAADKPLNKKIKFDD